MALTRAVAGFSREPPGGSAGTQDAERRRSVRGGDLLDKSVIKRFASIETPSPPNVFGNLFCRPARYLSHTNVESPQQGLLLAALRADLFRRSRELGGGLPEPESCVRGGRAAVTGSHDTDHGATDLAATMDAHDRAKCIERVDDDERRLERAIGTVHMQVDRLITDGIQAHERSSGLVRHGLVELAGERNNPPLKQFLAQPLRKPTTGRLGAWESSCRPTGRAAHNSTTRRRRAGGTRRGRG